jgi:hypothetical protein
MTAGWFRHKAIGSLTYCSSEKIPGSKRMRRTREFPPLPGYTEQFLLTLGHPYGDVVTA